MGGDERWWRRGGRRRAASRSCDQQLCALPSRRHSVCVAASAGTAAARHLRDEHTRATTPLPPSRQRVVDILVWRGTRPEWSRRSGVDCKP